VANGGWFGGSTVLMVENAAEGRFGIDLGMGSEGLGLEFFKKTLTLVILCRSRLLRRNSYRSRGVHHRSGR
jgi:hypothetical protein